VVGNVPDRNDRDTEFGVRSGITAFDAVELIFHRERGEDTVGVLEGVLEIFDQLGFCFRQIVAALFAVVGRFLALDFVEEGELGAGDVLHLLAEAANVVELAGRGDEGILVLRHGFSEAEKIPFGELERATNAFGDRFLAGSLRASGGRLHRTL